MRSLMAASCARRYLEGDLVDKRLVVSIDFTGILCRSKLASQEFSKIMASHVRHVVSCEAQEAVLCLVASSSIKHHHASPVKPCQPSRFTGIL